MNRTVTIRKSHHPWRDLLALMLGMSLLASTAVFAGSARGEAGEATKKSTASKGAASGLPTGQRMHKPLQNASTKKGTK